jgi:hypothetical protein
MVEAAAVYHISTRQRRRLVTPKRLVKAPKGVGEKTQALIHGMLIDSSDCIQYFFILSPGANDFFSSKGLVLKGITFFRSDTISTKYCIISTILFLKYLFFLIL